MKIALIAKYFGPTAYRGGRLKITLSKTKSVTVRLDYSMHMEDQIIKVATDLVLSHPDWNRAIFMGMARHPTEGNTDILIFQV